MRVISAPILWVEAQDQPCKSSEEIRKSASESLLTEFQQKKTPESLPSKPRNTSVIYFHRNRSAYTFPRLHTEENITSITAFGRKNQSKATKESPGPAVTCRTNSRRRKAKAPAPNLCPKKKNPSRGRRPMQPNNKQNPTTNPYVNPPLA